MQIDELQSSLLVHEQKFNCTSAIEGMTTLKISTAGEASSSKGGGQGKSRGRGRGGQERSRDIVRISTLGEASSSRGGGQGRSRGRGRGGRERSSRHVIRSAD